MCIEGLLYIQCCESTKVQRNLYILNDYIYFSNYPIQITFLVSQAVSSDLDGKGQVCGVHVPTTKPSVCIYIYIVCVYVCVF